MKKCIKCCTNKDDSLFHKNKNITGGLSVYCKVCKREEDLLRAQSKIGLITKIYSHQKQCSLKRNHPLPNYTKKELTTWLDTTPFNSIFKTWITSGYSPDLIPSCDRLNDYLPYTLNNLRIVTWKENRDAGHEAKIKGVNNKNNLAVIQMNMQGEYIKSFHSISEAKRATHIDDSSISKACNKKAKHAGGFTWKYRD